MANENINFNDFSDAELANLHERTSGALRDRRPIQVEDINCKMSKEDMDRAQKEISRVLAGLK